MIVSWSADQDADHYTEQALNAALLWESQVGDSALSELAPAIAASGATPDLSLIGQLASVGGIIGIPDISPDSLDRLDHGAPWERAIHDARALRNKMGNVSGLVPDRSLYDLLGMSSEAAANWSAPVGRSSVAVAIPMNDHQLKFVPRRHSPAGKAIEEAATEFDVSEQTIKSLLLNNGYIHHHWTDSLPYRMAA